MLGKFLRGEDVIDVGPAVADELAQLGLVFLRRARHDRNYDQVLGGYAQPLGQDLPGQRAEHLLRRTATRQVVQNVGTELLGKLHPGGAARGELRHVLALLLRAE